VAAFTEWFDRDTTGEVGFRSYEGLVAEVEREGASDPEGVLDTIMAFGRLAGIVTEKYHVFLKPPHRVHWCRECGALSRDNRCRKCGAAPIPRYSSVAKGHVTNRTSRSTMRKKRKRSHRYAVMVLVVAQDAEDRPD